MEKKKIIKKKSLNILRKEWYSDPPGSAPGGTGDLSVSHVPVRLSAKLSHRKLYFAGRMESVPFWYLQESKPARVGNKTTASSGRELLIIELHLEKIRCLICNY